MTRLVCSEELYQLLHRVGQNLVVLHDTCEPHAPGWSWRESDMSVPFQQLCTDAHHARLIDLGMHQPWGSPASLSSAGWDRLAELKERHLTEVRGVV